VIRVGWIGWLGELQGSYLGETLSDEYLDKGCPTPEKTFTLRAVAGFGEPLRSPVASWKTGLDISNRGKLYQVVACACLRKSMRWAKELPREALRPSFTLAVAGMN
jgi:hypothetical protein